MGNMNISGFPRMTADQFLKHELSKKKQETKPEISFAEVLDIEMKKESLTPYKVKNDSN